MVLSTISKKIKFTKEITKWINVSNMSNTTQNYQESQFWFKLHNIPTLFMNISHWLHINAWRKLFWLLTEPIYFYKESISTEFLKNSTQTVENSIHTVLPKTIMIVPDYLPNFLYWNKIQQTEDKNYQNLATLINRIFTVEILVIVKPFKNSKALIEMVQLILEVSSNSRFIAS